MKRARLSQLLIALFMFSVGLAAWAVTDPNSSGVAASNSEPLSASLSSVDPVPLPLPTLTADDRILILAPHPDDEVLGCAGVIQKAVAKKLPVRIVYLTYGDNNEWSFWVYRKRPILIPSHVRSMGEVRHDEAVAAAHVLGISASNLYFLGYPDFGTLQIWRTHWKDEPPFRSMLTRVTEVPYRDAWRPGRPYKGEAIVRDLADQLREFKPTRVFVAHAADHMPDHAALYLFTRIALWNLESEMHPQLYPYLIHFKRWPRKWGYHPEFPLLPPPELSDKLTWVTLALDKAEVEMKRAALQAHVTQMDYTKPFLLSFVRSNELFSDFSPVVLRDQAPSTPLSETQSIPAPSEKPTALTESEQSQFVGLEGRSVHLDHRDLVISVTFSRPLRREVTASLDLFGYRHDRPFEDMPKIHIVIGSGGGVVFDQSRRLQTGIILKQEPKGLVVRVPLDLLGDPEKILTGGHTQLKDVPLDWLAWRVLEVSQS